MLARKLRSIMVLQGKDDKDMAEVLKISRVSFSKKILGKVSFNLEEVRNMADELGLSPHQVWDIFFDNEVHANDTIAS